MDNGTPHIPPIAINKFLHQPAALDWKFGPGYDSKIECIGDIDGDGFDEVVVSIGQETEAWACLSICSCLELADLDSGWADQTAPLFAVQWSSPAGIPGWTYPTDATPRSLHFSYFTADIDGDNVKEIIAFCPAYGSTPASIGVLKWSENQLKLLWQSDKGAVKGDNGAFNLQTVLQAAEVKNAEGKGNVLAVLQSGSFGMLRWEGSKLTTVWTVSGAVPGVSGIGPLTLTGKTQMAVGDLDGDGSDEILFSIPGYNGPTHISGSGLGVAKWNGSQLNMIYCVAGGGSAPDYVTNLYQAFVADFGKTGQVKVCITTGTLNLYTLVWQQNQFKVLDTCIGSIPGKGSGYKFTIYFGGISIFGPAQQFYVADLDGTGPAFFVVGPNEFSMVAANLQFIDGSFYCTYCGDPNNWSLSSSNFFYPIHAKGTCQQIFAFAPTQSVALFELSPGQLSCTYKSNNILPGWNLNFIVNLPATSFTNFTGTQLELYQAISLALNPPAYGADGETGDVRYQFTNLNSETSFSTWGGQIALMHQMSGYSDDDWNAVAPVLAKECGWVGYVYSLKGNMAELASIIKAQQESDLSHCFDNIKVTPINTNSDIPYWIGAVVDAGIWGLAALPLGWAAQAAVALGASLFGSWANAPLSQTDPKNVKFGDFESMVDQLYLSAIDGSFLSLDAIVTDPVKLRVCGPLLESVWSWQLDPKKLDNHPGSKKNRVMLYKMMINADYSLFTWFSYGYNKPSYMFQDYNGNCVAMPVENVPDWAYGVYDAGNTNYNMWMLAQGTMSVDDDGVTTGLNIVGFPEKTLMDDLFQNLNILPTDMMNSLYGWGQVKTLQIVTPDCQNFQMP